MMHEAEAVEVAFDPVPRRAGGNDAGDVGAIGLLKERYDSRERTQAVGPLKRIPFARFVENLPVDRVSDEGFEVLLGVEATNGAAHTLRVNLNRQIVAMSAEILLPGFVDGDFSVENESVEVED